MQECESICNRLAIVANGSVCDIGSAQQIKDKNGEGYSLTVSVERSDHETSLNESIECVKEFVEKMFTNCELKYAYNDVLYYQINDKIVSWAQIFRAFESAKQEINVKHYSIARTNLENVFVSIVSKLSK